MKTRLTAAVALAATTAAMALPAAATTAAAKKRCAGNGATIKKNSLGRLSGKTVKIFGGRETTIYGCSTAKGKNFKLTVLNDYPDEVVDTIDDIAIKKGKAEWTLTSTSAFNPDEGLDGSAKRWHVVYNLKTGKRTSFRELPAP